MERMDRGREREKEVERIESDVKRVKGGKERE